MCFFSSLLVLNFSPQILQSGECSCVKWSINLHLDSKSLSHTQQTNTNACFSRMCSVIILWSLQVYSQRGQRAPCSVFMWLSQSVSQLKLRSQSWHLHAHDSECFFRASFVSKVTLQTLQGRSFGGGNGLPSLFFKYEHLKLKGFLHEVLNSHTYDILEMGHSSFVEGKTIIRPSFD